MIHSSPHSFKVLSPPQGVKVTRVSTPKEIAPRPLPLIANFRSSPPPLQVIPSAPGSYTCALNIMPLRPSLGASTYTGGVEARTNSQPPLPDCPTRCPLFPDVPPPYLFWRALCRLPFLKGGSPVQYPFFNPSFRPVPDTLAPSVF